MIITDEMLEAACAAYVKETSDQIGQDFSWPGVYREVEKGRIRGQVRAALEAALAADPSPEMIERLCDAVEGEMDGLIMPAEAARRALSYVLTGEEPRP